MSGQVSCECCGKLIDERSMAVVENSMQSVEGYDPEVYLVCQACNGYYEPAELLEKIKAQ